MTDHEVVFTINAEWGMSTRMICHREAGDPTRPCWPQHEDGTPFAADHVGAFDCTYKDWWENMDDLPFEGPDITFALPVTKATWGRDGDHFTFALGDTPPHIKRAQDSRD
jgi:hypothetical protein